MATANIKKFVTIDNLKTVIEEFKKHNRTIIDVTELPLSNIDSTKIYRLITDVPGKTEISHEYKLFIANIVDNQKSPGIAGILDTLNQNGFIENIDYFTYPLADVPDYGSDYTLLYIDYIKFQTIRQKSQSSTFKANFYDFHVVENADEFEALYNTLINKPFDETQEYKDWLSEQGLNKYCYCYVYIKNTDGLENKDFIDASNFEDLSWNNNQIPNFWEIDYYATPDADNYTNDGVWYIDAVDPIVSTTNITDLFSSLVSSDLSNLKDNPELYKVVDLVTENITEPVHTEALYTHNITGWEKIEIGGTSSIVYATNADVDLGFGILTFADNISIEDTSLVADDTTTIDEENHLLDLDGDEYNNGTNPEDNSGEDKE